VNIDDPGCPCSSRDSCTVQMLLWRDWDAIDFESTERRNWHDRHRSETTLPRRCLRLSVGNSTLAVSSLQAESVRSLPTCGQSPCMVSHDPSIRTFSNLTLMHWERRTVAAAAADCRPSALSDSGFAEALTQALCSGWRFLRLVWRTCIQRLSDILLVPVHRLLRPGVRVFRLIEIGIQPPSSHSSDAC
jgi:hypothetical protein